MKKEYNEKKKLWKQTEKLKKVIKEGVKKEMKKLKMSRNY